MPNRAWKKALHGHFGCKWSSPLMQCKNSGRDFQQTDSIKTQADSHWHCMADPCLIDLQDWEPIFGSCFVKANLGVGFVELWMQKHCQMNGCQSLLNIKNAHMVKAKCSIHSISEVVKGKKQTKNWKKKTSIFHFAPSSFYFALNPMADVVSWNWTQKAHCGKVKNCSIVRQWMQHSIAFSRSGQKESWKKMPWLGHMLWLWQKSMISFDASITCAKQFPNHALQMFGTIWNCLPLSFLRCNCNLSFPCFLCLCSLSICSSQKCWTQDVWQKAQVQCHLECTCQRTRQNLLVSWHTWRQN